jgi:hypothetical protein
MMAPEYPPAIDFRALGRHMSRQRYQRGSLKKVGKTRKMWRGRWHVYVKQPDGSEKICKREMILGPVSELTKGLAQERLDAAIKASAGQFAPGAAPDMLFAEVWRRYVAMKAGAWSRATSIAVTSVFAHHVLPAIGVEKLRDLTRDPLQSCLNRMAAGGCSYSAVHKARTYLAAALEYAMDERLIQANPARKIEVPTQMLEEICERYFSVDEIRRLSETAHGRERIVLRIFIDCGLRAQELFALRVNDVEAQQLRLNGPRGASARERRRAAARGMWPSAQI